jgi:DUF1680 family protein
MGSGLETAVAAATHEGFEIDEMASRRSFLQSAGSVGLALRWGRPLFAQTPAAAPLQEFGYGDVQLVPGLAQTQFQQTQDVLMGLEEDSLLKPWRLRAGLPAPGVDMGGWYDEVPWTPTPSGGHGYAPGHSLGQWISALARGYAITGDPRTRAKLERIVQCYDESISPRFYVNFRFPAYNYDKMVLGLVDAHRYAAIPNALRVLDRTTDAALPGLPPSALDRGEPQRQWRIAVGDDSSNPYTRDEPYTLPENLYIAYQLGAGRRYRQLADRFLLNQTFFDPLAEGTDVMPDHHAYSYFNALNSAMQTYLTTGSRMHLNAARFGFDMVQANQSFATGGWGPDEGFYPTDSHALYGSLSGTHRSFETPCGSYAHLKLTRYLLRVSADGRYGDSMERVFYNTVLGARPLQQDGRAFYYADYNQTGQRTYFPDAWPCCSGTLPQVAADYHICCYFHGADGIYVNLYLPSTVKWTASNGARLTLTQAGTYPIEGKIHFHLNLSRPSTFALRLRIPAWTRNGGGVSLGVNRVLVPVTVDAGFATLHRRWRDGDHIELSLPMPMRLEAIDAAHPNCVALVRGPLVLFALIRTAPTITAAQLLAARQLPGQPVWQAQTADVPIRLVPFTDIHEERYSTYINVSGG